MRKTSKFLTSLISKLLAVMLVFQFISIDTIKASAATTPTINFTTNGSLTVGSTIDIILNASNVENLYGASLDFSYDTSLLQVISISKGNIFGSSSVLQPINQIKDGTASLAYTLSGLNSGVSKNGTIAVIKAKILKAGSLTLKATSGNTSLAPTGYNCRVKLVNSDGTPVKYSPTNKTLTFTTSSAIINPTLSSFTANKASGQPLGTTVRFTATANPSTDAVYEFYVYENGSWVKKQAYSSKNYYDWKPSTAGTYKIRVRARHKNGTGASSVYKDLSFKIIGQTTTTLTGFTSDKASGQKVGTTITFTATANPAADTLYQFFVYENGTWIKKQDFSSKNTFAWKPSAAGDYKIRVRAMHKDGNAASSVYKDMNFSIKGNVSSTLTGFSVDKKSSQPAGTTITFTATATPAADTLYEFYVYEGGTWTKKQAFSTNNKFVWKPSKVADYKIRVRVKHKNSLSNSNDYRDMSFKVTEGSTLTSFTADKASGQKVGTTITFTAKATPSINNLYEFYVYDESSWTKTQAFSSKNTFAWKPSKAGTYKVRVRVRNVNVGVNTDYQDMSFVIK